jgi:outer membrane immunogenic protein
VGKFKRAGIMTSGKIVLCVLATSVMLLAPEAVLAADLSPTPAAPLFAPAAKATYDWSGAYVGDQVGYGWGRSDAGASSFYYYPGGDFAGSIPGFSFNTAGAIGGVEAGYGWQTNGVYLGIEADASAAGIKGTYQDDVNKFSVDSTLQWLATARLRVGLPVDRVLLFATGGLAVGGVQGNLHDFYAGPGTINSSSSSTNVGWTIGGGAAVALSPRWTVKAEYLYADLGSQKYDFVEPSGPVWSHIGTSARTTASIARVGLDYKF